MNIVQLNDEAQHELGAEIDRYDSKRLGLGDVFLEEVRRLIRSITVIPNGYPRRQGEVRRALPTRFPYFLLYQAVEGDLVDHVVIAVFDRCQYPRRAANRFGGFQI